MTSIIHHGHWLGVWNQCAAVGAREAVRFVAVSQPHAGDFLNAIPMRAAYRMDTWQMKLSVQRRLGLPLDAALAANVGRSLKGKVQDAMGDQAINDSVAGHAGRHKSLLEVLVRVLREVWGAAVEMEPANHLPYSNTYRPDLVGQRLARGGGGKHIVGDLKFLDPLSSNPGSVDGRGGRVAFGSTQPGIHAKVFGLAQRGEKGDGNFDPATGGKYVARAEADYSHSLSQGHEVMCLLFETFGGFSPAVVRLLKRAADAVGNQLSKVQYEQEASWSTRNWLSLQSQRISVALHKEVAWAIATELGHGAVRGGAVVGGFAAAA